jgi:hypothetical protein
MNTCTVPFNIEIGNSISYEITDFLLRKFPDVTVIDTVAFFKKFNFDPNIVSIFMVSDGGSVQLDSCWTLNGTYMTRQRFSNMTFGEYSARYQSIMNM